MAVEQRVYDISLDAAQDLEDYQYHVMAGSGAFGCDLAGDADTDSVGILQSKPDAEGVSAEVRRVGISQAVCGDTIPVWSKVTSDADGHIVVAAEGERYVGLAMEAGVVLQVISILMEFGTTPAGS